MSDLLTRLERDSIRAFVMSAGAEGYLSGRVLDYGCGRMPYRKIVLNRGGKQYNAFLEGRVKGDAYCLIMHLSNVELKKPKELDGGV